MDNGLLSLSSLLNQANQYSQPTPEDMAAARKEQLNTFLMSLIGARKGQELDAVREGGLLSMKGYNDALARSQQRRSQTIGQAAAMQELQKRMQEQQDTLQERDILKNYRPDAISGQSQGMPHQPSMPTGAMDMTGDAGTGLPGTPPMPQAPQQQAPQPMQAQGQTPGQNVTGPLAIKRQQQAQLLQLANAARNAGRGDLYLKFQQQAAQLEPELKDTKTLTVPDGSPTGKRVTVNFYKDGSQEVIPFGPDAEKLHFGTNGKMGNIGFDQFSGAQVSPGTPMQVTPGEQLSADMQGRGQDITVRGQNLTNARAQENNMIRRVEVDPMGILGINQNGAASGGGAAGATPAATAIASGLHGDEFLKTLPPSVAAQVKALADGSMSFPTGYALRSPMIQGLIQMVGQYDPNFDAVNYQARSKTRNDFTSGKSAENVKSLNTAMAHLDSLNTAMSQLNNFGGVGTVLNAPVNAIESAIGDPRQKNVELKTEAVANELAKVFRSSGMSQSEIARWRSAISPNMSPAQQKAVIQGALDLMNGRMQALGDTYQRGMGTTADGMTLLSPQAQAVYQKLIGGGSQAPSGGVVDFNSLPKR